MTDQAGDVVVVGGGHNGLACAGLLAKRGFKVVVLERRERVGGCAVTQEFHAGFKAPTLAHTVLPLRRHLVSELGLTLPLIEPEPRLYAPLPDGRGIALYGDPAKSAASIRVFSPKDAARYPEFERALQRVATVMSRVLDLTPPDVDRVNPGDVWGALRVALAWRGLGKGDAQRLLRWLPMSVADFADEWFESEPLKATLAARALRGSFAGPRSAGTAATLLLSAGAEGGSAAGSTLFVRGGPGVLAEALASAARGFGAQIRTGAEVAAIKVRDGRVTAVALRSGEELAARAVISSADPKTTFLSLIDPAHLDPLERDAIRHYRQEGMASKVHLALNALPAFVGAPDQGLLRGRIHVGTEMAALERAFDDAKYGEISRAPYLDVTIPTLADPALAPSGSHVMSVYLQFTPRRLRRGSWGGRRAELLDLVLATLEPYAPRLRSLVVGHETVTPEDIERDYGIVGGHPLHGEPSLDQIFAMRPIFGWGRYQTPIDGLFLCGAGAHPGGGLSGAPGANAAREIGRELMRRRRAH